MAVAIRGDVLRAARQAAGLTQTALAAEVGLSAFPRIVEYEAGQVCPSPAVLGRLAAAVGLEARDLLVVPAAGPDLRWLRYAAGLTLEDLAAAAGVTIRTVRGWEYRGRRSLDDQKAQALAAVLGASVTEVRAAVTHRVPGRS